MAATLGIEADKLMQKYEILNMAKASITQSCGAACIEAYCNILQERILEDVVASTGEKLYLRPRFSAGYGDVPLEVQRDIFRALECTKRIGLTLTESLLMYPTKSVTAFIGLTANPESCHVGKCKSCNNINCEFREVD
jgi:cobalamin-dependent methionine synthase I